MVVDESQHQCHQCVEAADRATTKAPGALQSSCYDCFVPTVLAKLQKWGDYESCGKPVGPSRFIPMKTPMGTSILSNWTLAEAPKHKYTVRDLLLHQQKQGLTVGLILDLTNHNCLYTEDIPAGLAYQHINLVAKQLPSPQNISEIINVARRFWAEQPTQYIAVHCSYGFNRTGFVMCCCLVELYGLSIDDAIEAFAQARPPGIKHEKFMVELRSRYGSQPSQSNLQRRFSTEVECDAAVLTSTTTITRQLSRQLSRMSSTSRASAVFPTEVLSPVAVRPSTPIQEHPPRPVSVVQQQQESASSSFADIFTALRIPDPEHSSSSNTEPDASANQHLAASLQRQQHEASSHSKPENSVPDQDSDPELYMIANEDSIGALMSSVLQVKSFKQNQRPAPLVELQQGCWQQTPSGPNPNSWQQTVT